MEATVNNNNTDAAAGSLVDSIRLLMDAVGNDEELKGKLEDVLTAITGEASGSRESTKPGGPAEPEKAAGAGEKENDEEEEEEEGDEDNTVSSASTDLSEIFTEDAVAGMVVGFIAGAAVVGGGVLLHKALSNN